MAPTLDIEIQNRAQSNQVFAYVTGQALQHSNHVCFIQADGKTPYFPESPSQICSPVPKDCAIKLGPAIVEPSISNPSDPNINILWDFCEFTFANNQIYANISYVDFVSLSVALTLIPQDGAPQKALGLRPDGFAHICAGLEDQSLVDASDWHKLVFESNGKKLRCLSPNNAIVMSGGNLFKGYHDPYVCEVWEKYNRTHLEVDTQAQWSKLMAKVANNKLEFPDIGSFAKPSTQDIFSCSTGPFASNVGALGPLTARISAALNRSTLHNAHVHPNDEKVSDYYKHPITNHYARLVHEANLDGRGYAFPYDDVSGGKDVDHSCFVNGNPKAFIVAIG